MKIIFGMSLIFIFSAIAVASTDPRDAECQSRGYDCYLSRKCVTDGNLRPFARLHPRFKAIMSEVQANPVAMFKYPKVFYICPVNN